MSVTSPQNGLLCVKWNRTHLPHNGLIVPGSGLHMPHNGLVVPGAGSHLPYNGLVVPGARLTPETLRPGGARCRHTPTP